MDKKRGWPADRADELAAIDELNEMFGQDVDVRVFVQRLALIARRRAREARAIAHRAELHEDWHNRLAYWAVDLANALDLGRGGRPVPSLRLSPVRSARDDRSRMKVLQQLAWEGVGSLEISRYPDGSALVTIANKDPFTLPRSLADLLEIIAAPTAQSRDGLVDFKPLSRIALLLGKEIKTRAQRHALHSLVNKLRTRLHQAGLLAEYIHSDRTLGYRFALRQAPAVGDDAV